MNNLRSALGELAYRDLARILKGITNGGGGNTSNGGIKVFKLICNTDLEIVSLGYNWFNAMLYTDVQFGEDVPEDIKQELLEFIEPNKTFANSVLEAINNGEAVCINRVLSDGTTNPYTGHRTVFASYSFGHVDVGAKDTPNPNAILLTDPDNEYNTTIINIPATIEDNKYVLKDYVWTVEL